jgi:hypothetical protein
MYAARSLVASCLTTGMKLVNTGAPPMRPGLPLAMSTGASVALVSIALAAVWLVAMFAGAASLSGGVDALEKLCSRQTSKQCAAGRDAFTPSLPYSGERAGERG